MKNRHGYIEIVIATATIIAALSIGDRSEAKGVEVDTVPQVETLNGYGTFAACPHDEYVTLLAPGPDGSHREYWTCSGSRGTVRYART